LLNSLWGKLAQRPNLSKTELVSDYATYWALLTDPKKVVTGEIKVNDIALLINWKWKEDHMDTHNNTSVAIASYVTAYARLELYNEMKKIEDSEEGRVLYFDTDFIIFKHRPHWYIPQLGDFLGQITDEVWGDYKTEGAKMITFASCGPKNYGYIVKMPNGEIKTKIKTKGIRLSENACKILNIDTVITSAKAYAENTTLTNQIPQIQFRSDKVHNMYTHVMEKEYKPVSTKRQKTGNFTVPYGTKM